MLQEFQFHYPCLFDPTCVPVRISINKLDIVPNWIVAGLVRVGSVVAVISVDDGVMIDQVTVDVICCCMMVR